MKCIALFLNWVLHGQSFQYVLWYNFRNMHAMSHRSDFFASSSRVDIEETAICCTMTLLSAVTQAVIRSFLIPAAMSDSQSLNTSMVEVMIPSRNKRVFIRDLSDLTFRIVFDVWWASMNIDLKRSIAWNNVRHASLRRFHLQCWIEETGSPGIICIVCPQVLRHPSEHGTSSMREHLLTKAHITKLNKLTESEVTTLTSLMVDETALAILKRQRSREITIVCSQREFIIDMQVDTYWLKWQTKHSKLAAKDFETSEFYQDTGTHYNRLGFVFAHIPCNAISNL